MFKAEKDKEKEKGREEAEALRQEQEASSQENEADAANETAEEASASDSGKTGSTDPLAQLQKKYEELNNQYLRTLAEYDNYRKRSQREKESIYPTAVANTVEKFLPVVDNFQRALECDCSDIQYKKGLEMISGSILKTMEDLAVEEVGIVGEAFDANRHHAVMHVDDDTLGTNIISAVLQKGYRIGERVIRYAMVSVAN